MSHFIDQVVEYPLISGTHIDPEALGWHEFKAQASVKETKTALAESVRIPDSQQESTSQLNIWAVFVIAKKPVFCTAGNIGRWY